MGTNSNFALRLPASLKKEAEETARADGTTLNQFIVTAVAEKLSALRTADYFAERARRAGPEVFDRVFARDQRHPLDAEDALPDGASISGLRVRVAEPCPEGGLWRSEARPDVTVAVRKGAPMPPGPDGADWWILTASG